MGIPECARQKSPFLNVTTTTTTTTTEEPDFFILPTSGVACPSVFDIELPLLPSGNLIFVCNSSVYYEECVLQSAKYIRVADIEIDRNRCKKYRLTLSGDDKDSFFIHNFRLYMYGEVLDFDKPSKYYNVTLELRDADSLAIIDTVNHSVHVETCICSGN